MILLQSSVDFQPLLSQLLAESGEEQLRGKSPNFISEVEIAFVSTVFIVTYVTSVISQDGSRAE